MSHDDKVSNKSGNRLFNDVLQANLERRKVLTGGLALAAGSFLISPGNAIAAGGFRGPYGSRKKGLIDFTPVPVADGNGPWPTISEDYEYDVLIPWGEPLEPGGPAYQYPPSAKDQAQQIGIGHDGMWFFQYVVKSLILAVTVMDYWWSIMSLGATVMCWVKVIRSLWRM